MTHKPDTSGIVYVTNELLQAKDFTKEVRGQMDVEQFASQGQIMLDTRADLNLDQVLGLMLNRVLMIDLHNDKSLEGLLEEAKESLFVAGSDKLLAHSIKSLDPDELNNNHGKTADDNWLCAFCHLSQLKRRHFVLARFKSPGAYLDRAKPTRLLMLIVVPKLDKGTKCGLEIGRTFATLLQSKALRDALLGAKNEPEVRSLFVLKAHQLAGCGNQLINNRHKYQFEPAVSHSIATGGDRFNGATNCDVSVVDLFSHEISLNDDEAKNQQQLFKKNPNASKLFELIYSDAYDKSNGHDKATAAKTTNGPSSQSTHNDTDLWKLEFGKAIWHDLTRRLHHYPSDFKDAFIGPPRTIEKTLATIWFLYFGILLPIIAFSSLNLSQTHGQMGDLRKSILGQAIGGLAFALVGGQPLVIIMTTAPLCLYTKVIYSMCSDYGYQFGAMYAAVGLWNALFLSLYSLFGFSKLMRWCTRSTEEIFAMFIVVAFITDACKDTLKNFELFYHSPSCDSGNGLIESGNQSLAQFMMDQNASLEHVGATKSLPESMTACRRDASLLFLLLMLGTVWLATFLYRFNKTPFFGNGLRNLLSDYALPVSVIAMSFVGSYIFNEVFVEHSPVAELISLEMADVGSLPLSGILLSAGLGFTLSLLFFMDQNISAAMVSAPQHRLKKGSAYHFDLLVIAILNSFLTLYGLPMMHGVLPHSPLHARSLSDIMEKVEEGYVVEHISNCRENRVTALVAHLLVLVSLFLIPNPIAYIPRAVLNGLFLYMAITSLDGLQIFDRMLLMFTQQSRYPPNRYIRRCPQRKIHLFTLVQLAQLLIMCLFGFSPINSVEMFFPVIILAMIPFRQKIVPRLIDDKYLNVLDGKQ